MNNDFAPPPHPNADSIINEHGFTAILRNEEENRPSTGIIGAPRVTPTRAGLWIEDGYPAALDTILIAILEDFAIRENDHNRPNPSRESGARPGPIALELRRHPTECTT